MSGNWSLTRPLPVVSVPHTFSSTLKRALPTLPRGRVSRQNAFVDEAVEGVDDPTARWSSTLSRTLPTLPRGRVSRQKSPCQPSGGRGRRSNGTLVEYALTNATHPPSWEGQSAKRPCQRSGGRGRRSNGTLVEYALTNATHPPSWEGQSAKIPLSTKRWKGVDDPAARWLPTLPSGRVSQPNAFVDEAVGGVDDPTARWAARWLPTLPRGRVSRQNALVNEAVGGVDDPTARWAARWAARWLA
jgi:hypothetical protein